jgi:LAO/AO transport system kinase
MHQELLQQIKQGDTKALARGISLIENEQPGFEELLRSLPADTSAGIIGITGPPGAGKSTLVDAMIGELTKENLPDGRQGKKIAVLCVDPSSPFNLGALLGDRIRMSEWYTNPNVFIRSIATRGSMGGLSSKIVEITDLARTAKFDHIIIETVGVGQSEIEIAGLADITVVVLVPEGGDEVQTMKAGLMEVADIFVVNKSDRPDAELFVKNLRQMLAPAFHTHKQEVAIIKTIASERKGIAELMEAIKKYLAGERTIEKHLLLLTDKAWQLLIHKRMKDISRIELKKKIENEYKKQDFNLYSFIDKL